MIVILINVLLITYTLNIGPGNNFPDVNQNGTEQVPCSTDPMTGFFRDGYCRTDGNDHGSHTVCAQITNDWLAQQASVGNNLATPHPQYGFPGLKEGDYWCVCAIRWRQAFWAGATAKVKLDATNRAALNLVEEHYLRQSSDDCLNNGNSQNMDL